MKQDESQRAFDLFRRGYQSRAGQVAGGSSPPTTAKQGKLGAERRRKDGCTESVGRSARLVLSSAGSLQSS